jgi:anaerobic ribonucleoside-triphosphate reductase activating protein
MNIAGTQFSLKYSAFEIYLSGCRGNCKGCHNPELKNFNAGTKLTASYFTKLNNKLNMFADTIESIWILGGEPLDQDISELEQFLRNLHETTNARIYLFTRYNIKDIPLQIKVLCDYIKSGEYDENLKVDNHHSFGVKLSSSNQKIYKMR